MGGIPVFANTQFSSTWKATFSFSFNFKTNDLAIVSANSSTISGISGWTDVTSQYSISGGKVYKANSDATTATVTVSGNVPSVGMVVLRNSQ